MKALVTGAALGLALVLAGCGENGAGGPGQASPSAPVAAVPPPAGQSWSDIVTATPEGGFMMGNPNAAVKLVEFASLTCHVCAEFSEQGEQPLIERYVETGKVSFEIRNFIRDPADLAAALLARCNGPAAFFKLADQMYAAQDEWLGKLQQMTPAQQQSLQSLPPQQTVAVLAQQAGLIDFVRVRGVPTQKAQQCLANEAELNRLVQMQQKATQDMPNFAGTPTFTINGEMVQNAAAWVALEPRLKAAVGG
ncbi:MAG TPA: thioredoxin domain-containing protein [Allosphingosinicella sp.]|jgi:protein-disulfide isomerase